MKIEPTTERYQESNRKIDEINKLLIEVDNDTGLYSTSNHTYEHSSFKKLVGMGDILVNYIMHVITQQGASWTHFYLLGELIPKESRPKKTNPGSFPHTFKYWLDWWLESEYYKKDNIYHNLVD